MQESNKRVIELKEDNPSALFAMLRGMYNYKDESSEPKNLVFLVALFHLADKYDAPKLRATYVQSFDGLARFSLGSEDLIIALHDIFDGAPADKSLQEAAITLCTLRIDHLVHCTAFNELLDNTPALSAALVRQMHSQQVRGGAFGR